MQELLKKHISILNTEQESSHDVIDNLKSYLRLNGRLDLDKVELSIANAGFFRTPVITVDMTFTILISKYTDYGAVFNSVEIHDLKIHPDALLSIKDKFSHDIKDVIRSVVIKELYKEHNSELLAHLKSVFSSDQNTDEDYVVLHPINIPSFMYKGQLAFNKSTPETKKSVAKEWRLINASEFVAHSEVRKDVWVAIKSITLRKDAKKIFFLADKNPEVVINWLATPLAMRDPSREKTLFDLHSAALTSGSPELLKAIESLMVSKDPIDEVANLEVAQNIVSLKDITNKIKKSISDYQTPSSSTATSLNLSSKSGVLNPYTLAEPKKVLDPNKSSKPIRFQLSDLNHSVAKNNPDKFDISGWLVAYFNTRELVDADVIPKKWVEYFLLETAESFYLTKVTRSNSKRNTGIVRSFKINTLSAMLEQKLVGDLAYKKLTS